MPVEVAARAIAAARDARVGVLVSIGGGSATGLAKAVARDTGLPILAVPTTYAGSEMTPIWGQSDQGEKTTGRDSRVLPRIVVYDPALTVSMPPELTAASGMNALAHAVESLYAPDRTPQSSEVAEEAIRALAHGLPRAVSQPDDMEGAYRSAPRCLARRLGVGQHHDGPAPQTRPCARRQISAAARRGAQCAAATGGRVQCARSTGCLQPGSSGIGRSRA